MHVKVCLLADPIVAFFAYLFAVVVDFCFDDEYVLLVATLFEIDGFFFLVLFLDEKLRRDAVVMLLFFLFIGQIDMCG